MLFVLSLFFFQEAILILLIGPFLFFLFLIANTSFLLYSNKIAGQKIIFHRHFSDSKRNIFLRNIPSGKISFKKETKITLSLLPNGCRCGIFHRRFAI